MDSNVVPPGPALPRNSPFDASRAEAPPSRSALSAEMIERNDRAGVFGQLVKDDGDIAGLVAYSIYKQHKLDWLRAFEAAKGRAPDEDEIASYIIGEGTPRRLATYRHLAEATLAGRGPEIEGAPATIARPSTAGRRFGSSIGKDYSYGLVALYAIIAVLFIIGFYFAMHYTVASR